MARKTKHVFSHTMGDVHKAFADVIDRFGGSHNREYEERVQAVPIDGSPLGSKPAERRHPRSAFYSQSYFEALAAARVLVQLGLDREVADVVRREPPMPDVEVLFRERPPVYIEHTNVAEFDGLSFARHREELNLALEDRRVTDPGFREVWERGNLAIRMTDPGVGARPDVKDTVAEIARFASGFDGDVRLLKPSAALWPAMAAYRVNAFYHVGQHPSQMVCQEDAMSIAVEPPWVARRLADAVATKRTKIYDPAARPIWLLITVEAEHLLPDVLPGLAADGLATVDVAPFDRVIVWAAGCEIAMFQ
jgi:hypothetical protein